MIKLPMYVSRNISLIKKLKKKSILYLLNSDLINILALCLRLFDSKNVKSGEYKHTGAEETTIWR